ncbi:MAG: TonB-dependent receptor, partial [Acidobacteria bacterium]|nr:TonB-dependent receptor [Acidobacteriota bacterium]
LVNLLADGSELARIELDQHADFDAVTPKIVVEYTSSAETLFYGSASRGYKAGGFNSNTFQPAPFDPEDLWAYELGVKATLADGRIRLNAAAFYYDYRDLQLNTIPPGSPPGTFQVVINAAKSTVTGLEAEILAAPDDNLELNFSFSLLDAKFDEFLALNPNDVASGEVDRGGKRMPRAPEFSVNLGAQYGFNVSTGRVILRGEYRYQDDIFLDPFQDPLVAQKGYSIVNARLTYEHGDGKWRISAFGRNLANKDFLQSDIRVDGLFGNLQFFGPPRIFGLQFDYGL